MDYKTKCGKSIPVMGIHPCEDCKCKDCSDIEICDSCKE